MYNGDTVMQLEIEGHNFIRVCAIEPKRTPDESIWEFMPQERYKNTDNVPLNRYGKGPFCKFTIPKTIVASGVYAMISDEKVKYIGECQNLSSRINMGYGNISPRNCYVGGQETNCRVNNLIFNEAKLRSVLSLWFLETDNYKHIEQKLRSSMHPAWNRA